MENKLDWQKFSKDSIHQSEMETENKYRSFPMDQMARYYLPMQSGDVLQAVPTEEMVVEGEEMWNNSLIVQLVGSVPKFSIVHRMIKQLWGRTELFTQRGIGCVASVLGRALYTDRITSQRKRLAFARVCVEIQVTKEIPKKIEVLLRGRVVEVMVYVPLLPLKCPKCNLFGHTEKTCVKRVEVKQWQPKKDDRPSMEEKEGVFLDRGKSFWIW
ncbi:hypothetical protein PTKIN_Ptkin06aG0183500 [Pterospermum kingtungense]